MNCTIERYATRAEWVAARRTFVGASESAAIFGCGYADQSIITVWEEKVYGRREDSEHPRMMVGRLIEPALREIFAEVHGRPCHAAGLFTVRRHPEFPWLAATLDGLTDGNEIPVELKNVGAFNRLDWEDEPPLKFQIQMQHQLAVTGAPYGYLFALVGGNEPVLKKVERHNLFIESLLLGLEQFWRHVTERTLPLADASEATSRALGRIFREREGVCVTLPPDAGRWAFALEAARSAKREAEEQERKWSNLLKGAIGEASEAVIPGYGRLTYRTVERDGYYVEPSRYRVLRKAKGDT